MPQVDPAIVDELRRRGLLANSGNLRLVPFNNSTAVTPDPSNSGIPANTSAIADVLAANGGVPAVGIAAGTPPIQAPNVNDPNADDMSWLAPLVAGASGAAIGEALGRRRATTAPLPSETEVANALAANAGSKGNGQTIYTAGNEDDIIEGEWTEVDPDKAGPNRLTGPDELKRLEGPTTHNAITRDPRKQTRTPKPQDRRAVADAIVARNQRGQANDVGTIYTRDAYTDMSPEDLQKANALTDELISRRQRGNARMFKGQPLGRKHLPTGNVEREGIFNQVVRMIREGRIKPNQILKAIP